MLKNLISPANFNEEVSNSSQLRIQNGIYFGWAQVETSPNVLPMVMSLGWNPFFKNDKKSAEVHIIHPFNDDFYGAQLKVAILGFIRPEYDYKCVDDLIHDIHIDINVTLESLKRHYHQTVVTHSFFSDDRF